MMQFSSQHIKVAQVFNTLMETGSFRGDPGKVDVLAESTGKDDGAGISYGTSQATENSGSLWSLLYLTYPAQGGAYVEALAPYQEQLYPQGPKGALTQDQTFRRLLAQIGRDDPAMSRAQGVFFYQHYMVPALWICERFALSEGLSLVAIYDFCIQSNPPGATETGRVWKMLVGWHHEYMIDRGLWHTLDERAWSRYMVQRRHQWLQSMGKVAWTAYRTDTLLEMMCSDDWACDLPLAFTFKRAGYRPGWKDWHMQITPQTLLTAPGTPV